MQSPFEIIADEFERASIRYLLVGGHAVNQYAESRHTVDIDVAIHEADLPRVLPLMKRHGYEDIENMSSFTRLRHESRRLPDIDLMLLDEETFSKLLAEAATVKFTGRSLLVPAMMHLIAMKLHALKNNPRRENKDLLDIVSMCEQNDVDVEDEGFRATCIKFGGVDGYEKVRMRIQSRG